MSQSMAIEQEASEIADSLIAKHGPSAQNVAAQSLSDAVTANDLAGYKKWLAVRKNILERSDTIRYTRRLSDKLIWAIEQSLEMDLPQLAAVLGVIAVEARKAEQQVADDIRLYGSNRPPLGGAVNTDEPEYTRRLSDKLIWALQQSVDQGQIDIATMLKPLYEVAVEGDAARAAAYKERNP
ncbi:MAG: hypothetical protein ACOY15_03080 [Pseudomonadota bacterium]